MSNFRALAFLTLALVSMSPTISFVTQFLSKRGIGPRRLRYIFIWASINPKPSSRPGVILIINIYISTCMKPRNGIKARIFTSSPTKSRSRNVLCGARPLFDILTLRSGPLGVISLCRLSQTLSLNYFPLGICPTFGQSPSALTATFGSLSSFSCCSLLSSLSSFLPPPLRRTYPA